MQNFPLGLKYYLELNVDLILNVIKMYLEYGSGEPIIIDKNETNPVVISSNFIKNADTGKGDVNGDFNLNEDFFNKRILFKIRFLYD
jgi:hypothetical protein